MNDLVSRQAAIDAINTAIRALGGKATMAEIWAWARKPEKEVNE